VNTGQPRILVVEDDSAMRALMQEFLGRNGMSVIPAAGGERISEVIVRERIDLILLDLMLPGDDGLTICKRLRAAGTHVPIIMVTAKGDTVDRVVGLQVGADDYVAKPFDPHELLARIGAVLRRHSEYSRVSASGAQPSLHTFGPFELDTTRRTLTKSGEVIILKAGEFALLHALVSHARQPLSRQRLMDLARQREVTAHRSVDVQIAHLRRLIEKDPSNPCYIRTVWGFGYVFSPEGEESG
jgi:two-component system phosphate regulon response regulator OmpR